MKEEINNVEPTKVWNIAFIGVFVVNIVMLMGQYMLNPLISVLANRVGASGSLIGLLMSVFSIVTLLMRPFSGSFSLAFAKKRIVFISGLAMAGAFFLYGSAESITLLMIARVLHGISVAFCTVSMLAMASNTVPSDKLGAGIGFFAVGQSLAFAIGPSVGLILVDAIGYTKTFYSGAVVILIGVFSLLFINIQEKTKKEPLKLKLNNMFAKEATVPMLIITFITMASINVSTFIVLFAQSRNIANIGLYFTVNAILALVTRPLVSVVSDRVGVRKVLFVALLFGALSMVLISISRSLPMILAAAVCSALGPQISQPSIQVLCIKSVSPERRGIGGSTNYLGWDIGGLIGPLLAGYFVDLVGYANMFLVLLVPCLLAILTYCVFYRRIKEIDTRTYTKAT